MSGLLDTIRNLRTHLVPVLRFQSGSASRGVWTPGDQLSPTVDVTNDALVIPDHGMPTGHRFTLATTGVMPTGLAAGTTYYAIVVDASTIKVATTQRRAKLGTAVAITDAGSGTLTFTFVIEACVQPATGLQRVTGGRDMREDDDNQHVTEVLVLWTSTLLRPRVGARSPDEISLNDDTWTVFRVEDWWAPHGAPGSGPHYKVVFTRKTNGSS